MNDKIITKIGLDLIHNLGLNSAAISYELLKNFVQSRMKTLGVKQVEDYYVELINSPQEMQELIELIIVPETWFFREAEAFIFLKKYLSTRLKKSFASSPLRILSMPCSTGEEPYSIAMMLCDMGLESFQFEIDAIDISKKALAKAKLLTFSENSFRENNRQFMNRYFERRENSDYIMSKQIGSLVHFHFENILKFEFFSRYGTYDIIFCRNFLMYLTPKSQVKVFNLLQHLLKGKGLLIIGEAEHEIIKNYPFDLISSQQGSVFVKSDSRFLLKKFLSKEKKEKKITIGERKKDVITDEHEHTQLAKMVRLANDGYLEEAKKLGRNYLSTHDLDPQAYFFLGILHQALGQEFEAEEFLQKALYLDPQHYEAIIHLSVLMETQGKLYQANLLRKRAKKIYSQYLRVH